MRRDTAIKLHIKYLIPLTVYGAHIRIVYNLDCINSKISPENCVHDLRTNRRRLNEIYYEVHGTTDPTLVLVSGYIGIANIWQPLIAKLGPEYRCIACDSRGFGRSSEPKSPESYTIPSHAADLDAVIKALGNRIDERIILLTHFMGGNIATEYYHTNQCNVACIVYTGTYFNGKLVGNFLTYDALTSGIESPSKCIEIYTSMGLNETIALEAAKLPAYARRNNAKAPLSFEVRDNYTTINVPGLIIQEERGTATPVRCVEPIQQAIPSCRLEVLDEVRYFPPTEAPSEVKRLVDEFTRTLL